MSETIVAISSAIGEGAIGIVRMSGPDSLNVLSEIFKKNNKRHTFRNKQMYYGHIIKDALILDEVMVVYMAGPHTYTKEDIVEIYCHGGIIAIKRVLDFILEKNVKMAAPGEFTQRAFLNGRLDLSQAEAVMDLVSAKTDKGFDVALDQLKGALSSQVENIRQALLRVVVGALYHAGIFNFGLSYITPQKITHEGVYDFDNDGTFDDLDLQSPHTLIFGVAAQPSAKLLAEVNMKWYNWGDAKGYEDFDWDNQWVFALGVQYRPIGPLALRAGFNYGKNPVKEHNGFDIMGTTEVQGTNLNTLQYEMFRTVGFPAVVEKHVTFGIGYDLTSNLIVNVTYMHAFEETIKEVSAGNMASLESSLSENSYSLGLTWRF